MGVQIPLNKESKVTKSAKSDDVGRIVEAIDETRVAEHFRNPDRPSTRFVKPRSRQDPAIGRAKTRLRTALYRSRLDQRCAPSTADVGMALVVALATVPAVESLSRGELNLVGRALADLQRRGFDLNEVKSTLRRLRARMREQSSEQDGPSPF